MEQRHGNQDNILRRRDLPTPKLEFGLTLGQQRTVGKLAYRVFRARGAMRHGLDQVIPGEVVDEEGETQDAIRRLKSALLAFKGHDADLKPHFAYGALTKDEYAIAHILHINNHLEEFRLV